MLFFVGRKNDKYTDKLIKFIKKRSKIKVKTILISSAKDKVNISKKFDYLISFRNLCLFNKKTLENCQKIAINFHPGPPNYRGIGCLNYAMYNEEKEYGVTAHIIDKKVDSGKILSVKKFKICKNETIESLLVKSHNIQFKQAKEILERLLSNKFNKISEIKKYNNYKWSKRLYTRKDLLNLYEIKMKFNEKKINKIIRSTNTSLYKPYIRLNGYKFFFKNEKN